MSLNAEGVERQWLEVMAMVGVNAESIQLFGL
jgi:hypothetical protein